MIGTMPKKIDPIDGQAAITMCAAALDADLVGVNRNLVAMAVRYSLQQLEDKYPGHAVEVRVPPFGAVQCIDGPRHRRGTPPNVVEMAPATWLKLFTGAQSWDQLSEAGYISASGIRADLHAYLPL